MGTKSQFFRAFVAGQTISDGREVTPEMIDQIVETFNIDTYTPGINIEHITGFSPQPPFNRYGDVIAVKAQTDDVVIDGKTEKRKALYMQIDAHDALVALAKDNQKPFPSVELTPSYAGCGKVGLVAAAFTDNPASIATQKLKFSRSSPDTLISHGTEGVELKFEGQPADPASGAFAAIKNFFEKFTPTPPAAPTPPAPPAPTPPADPANDNYAQLREGLGLIGAGLSALDTKFSAEIGAIRGDFGTLKTQLENTADPRFNRQPTPGSGAAGQFATDC